MSSAVTSTSTFNYCTPTASTATSVITSTVYTTVLPAACETGTWDATYTITDYCYGKCQGAGGGYGYLPPGFGVTTVHCPVCPTKDIVITCPTTGVAYPTGGQNGGLPPPVITGNGITATCDKCGPTPTITIHESVCTKDCGPAVTTYPPGPVNPVYPPGPVNPVSPSKPAGPGPSAPPGGAYPVQPSTPGGANPPGPVYPVNPGTPGQVYPPGPVSPANPGAPKPPMGTGSVVTPKPGQPGYPTNPPVVVAGATSVSRSLGLISGLAAIAGYVYLL